MAATDNPKQPRTPSQITIDRMTITTLIVMLVLTAMAVLSLGPTTALARLAEAF